MALLLDEPLTSRPVLTQNESVLQIARFLSRISSQRSQIS